MKTMDTPRSDYKPHAPRIVSIEIPQDMIGAVIGPGGKIIQEIQKETETVITIEEKDNKGLVSVSAPNGEAIEKAMTWIKNIVAIPEVGEIYNSKVKTIVDFGAFVEILPGKEGLLHISEIEWRRLDKVDEVLKVGDIVDVKLMSIDKNGKYKLSRKILLPKPPREDKEKKSE
jgi:polyribonucleotide nucleotidyltransferase